MFGASVIRWPAPDEIIERALFEHGPDDWDENDCGIIADAIKELDDFNAIEREHIAHAMWTAGATEPPRKGCRYQGYNAEDGDYDIQCKRCEKYLLILADHVLSALTRREPNSERRRALP